MLSLVNWNLGSNFFSAAKLKSNTGLVNGKSCYDATSPVTVIPVEVVTNLAVYAFPTL